VVASALGASLVAMAAEWFLLVGQARTATAGSFAALGIGGQLGARLPLLVGAVAAAQVIVLSTTTMAMRGRRLGEAGFFELTLGAPRPTQDRQPWSRASAKVCPVIAVVVIGLGAAPGLLNTFATQRRPRGQVQADQAD